MNPVDKTARDQTDAVSFELDLRHSPQKVWRALTDPTLLAEWLLPVVDSKLDLARGAAFTLKAPAQPGWDGIVNARFVEIETHKKLSYTWRVGDMDTVVTFALTPTDAGTHLSLVQSGFKPHQKNNFGGARYGWRLMGGKLIDLLDRDI